MKILGSIVIVAALVLSMALAPAQGKRRPVPGGLEPDDRCTCSAQGARCMFGESGGCSVSCPPGWQCQCDGGSCFVGFPTGSSCGCVA